MMRAFDVVVGKGLLVDDRLLVSKYLCHALGFEWC